MPKFMNASLTDTPRLLNINAIQEVWEDKHGKTQVIMAQIDPSDPRENDNGSISRIDEHDMPIREFIRRMTTDLLEI